MANSDNWMERAFKPSHAGRLTAKAKMASETPMEFARDHYHAKGKTGQQARAAVNAQGGRKPYGS